MSATATAPPEAPVTEPEDQQTIDDQAAAGDGDGKSRTRYKVIWARVPDDEDETPRYRELAGLYEATNGSTAKRRAFADEEQADHGQIVKAAEENGIYLRAIPESSWGPEKPEPTRTTVRRETSWGF